MKKINVIFLLILSSLLILGCTASEKEIITGNAVQGAYKDNSENQELENRAHNIKRQKEELINSLDKEFDNLDFLCPDYADVKQEIQRLYGQIGDLERNKILVLSLKTYELELDLKFNQFCNELEKTDVEEKVNNIRKKDDSPQISKKPLKTDFDSSKYLFDNYHAYEKYILPELSELVDSQIIGSYSSWTKNEGKLFTIMHDDGDSWGENLRFWAVEINGESGRIIKYEELPNNGCSGSSGNCPITQDLWWDY